jgi:hypothetical protein
MEENHAPAALKLMMCANTSNVPRRRAKSILKSNSHALLAARLLLTRRSYVDRLVEQNDQYKTAMRVLYANRRLSIHPDNIVIPVADSEDAPLIHDILERLGLLIEDSDDLPVPKRAESHAESPRSISTSSISEAPWSTESISTSPFETSALDTSSSFIQDSGFYNDVLTIPDFDSSRTDSMALETDLPFDLPYEIYTAIDGDKPSAAFNQLGQGFALFPDMIPQSWDQLNAFQEVMDGNMPLEPSWMTEKWDMRGSY